MCSVCFLVSAVLKCRDKGEKMNMEAVMHERIRVFRKIYIEQPAVNCN